MEAQGTGTCAGLNAAIKRIPASESFMLIWCDLVLSNAFKLPYDYDDNAHDVQTFHNYVGLAGSFPCRWKFENTRFSEEHSEEYGVAGLFLFADKNTLANVPENGEFVRWLSIQHIPFETFTLEGAQEFGLLEKFERLPKATCRPFNRIEINGDVLVKRPIDAQGEALAMREQAWYRAVSPFNLDCVVRVHTPCSLPLAMEYIGGGSLYSKPLSSAEKRATLVKIVRALKSIHELHEEPADESSVEEAYFSKTIARIQRVRDLIPFADRPTIIVNGKCCRNVFFHIDELKQRVDALVCDRFALIHGDCTFSNILLRENGDPVLIDPRGYFGRTELYGDVRYDWAKLYYSLVGNYDQFNIGHFALEVGGPHGSAKTALPDGYVQLSIASNGWEDLEELFFKLTSANPDEIRLIHAIIWLSLTTYAWQDYDSICGAFYNGLFYLEDAL